MIKLFDGYSINADPNQAILCKTTQRKSKEKGHENEDIDVTSNLSYHPAGTAAALTALQRRLEREGIRQHDMELSEAIAMSEAIAVRIENVAKEISFVERA